MVHVRAGAGKAPLFRDSLVGNAVSAPRRESDLSFANTHTPLRRVANTLRREVVRIEECIKFAIL